MSKPTQAPRGPPCSACSTTASSQWRGGPVGRTVCNNCWVRHRRWSTTSLTEVEALKKAGVRPKMQAKPSNRHTQAAAPQAQSSAAQAAAAAHVCRIQGAAAARLASSSAAPKQTPGATHYAPRASRKRAAGFDGKEVVDGAVPAAQGAHAGCAVQPDEADRPGQASNALQANTGINATAGVVAETQSSAGEDPQTDGRRRTLRPPTVNKRLKGYIPDPMDAVFDPYSSPAADPRDALLERYTGSRIPLHQPGFNLLNGNQGSQQHPMHALNMGGLHGQQPVVAPTSSSTELMAAFFSIIDVTSENRDSASCGLQQTGSDEAEVQGQRTGDMTRSDQTLSTDVFSRQHSHAPVPSAVSNIRSAQEDEVVAAQLETPGLDAGHAAADLAKSRIKGRSAARFRSSACSQRVTMGQVTADATAALSSAIDASGVSSHPFQAPRSSGAASLSHQSRGPGVEPMDGLQYAEGQQTAHRPQFAATSQSQSIHRHHHRQPAVSAVQSQLDFTQYMAQQEAGSTLRSSNAQKSSKVRTAGVQTRYQPHMHAPHQASARSALLGQEGGRSRAEAAKTRHQQQQQPAQQQMGVSKAAPSGSALVGLLARQSKQAQHGAAEQQMSWTRVTPRVSTEADSKMLQLRRSKAAAAAVGHCSDTKQSTNCRVPQPQQRMHRAPGPSRLGPFHPTAGDVFRFAQSSSVPPAQCLVDGAPGQPAAGASSAFMPAIHRVPDDVAGVTASCGWSAAPPTHHQQGLTEFASSAEQPKSTFAQFAAAAVAGNPLSSGTQTLHRRGLTARSLQHFGGQRGAEAGGGCHPDIQSAVPLADNDPDAHMDTNRHSNAVCPAQHSGGHRDAQAEEGCQQDMQSADSHPVSYTNGRTNRNSIAARPAHRFGGHRGATADGGCQQDIQSAAVPAERPFSLQTTQVNSGTCTHEAYASGGNQCLDAAAAAGCQQDSQSTDNMDIDSSHYDPVTNYTQHQADGNLLHEAQAPPANSFNTNPTTTDLAKSSLQPALSRRPLLGQDSLNSEATYAAHVGSEFMVGRQQLGNAEVQHTVSGSRKRNKPESDNLTASSNTGQAQTGRVKRRKM